MTVIGYLIAGTIAIAALPLIPFFLLYLLVDRVTGVGSDRGR